MSYYNYRAQIYFEYHLFEEISPERGCSLQDAMSYGACLDVKSFESNLEGTRQRPFYYRSRWALANSALNLKQDALAIQLYDEVLSMVPNSRPMRNDIGSNYINLANAYLEAERPEAALNLLEAALAIKPHGEDSSEALLLFGTAYQDLERLNEATKPFEMILQMGLSEKIERQAHEALAEIYKELGETKLAKEHTKLANPP